MRDKTMRLSVKEGRAGAHLLLAVLACVAVGCTLHASAARASYTLPALVSYQGTLEADNAYSPAISANGQYVVFTGSFDGVSGVYRKELHNAEKLELVAGADAEEPALSAPDAGAPSISGEGRYVSFTTTKALDPVDDPGNGCSSVYVRDMEVPIGQPGAYELASALNGTSEGITYEGTAGGGSCPGGGSAAAGRVALSENGEKVAFTVIGKSNLTSGVGGAIETPPAQVAVRNLDTKTTTLVSQTMSSLGSSTPEAVPNGAAFTDGAAKAPVGASTVALSADGSTVSWMGVDIPEQAPASNAPATGGGDAPYGYTDEYAEPLWRRIADGPSAATRRVTGGDDPICGCAGPLATSFDPGIVTPGEDVGPEYGTYDGLDYNGDEALDFFASITPQLSANGQGVAFLSTAPDTGEEPDLPGKSYVLTANAFVVNMASGLSRAQALTRLTEWAGTSFGEAGSPSNAPIDDVAISPSGMQVAFTTERIDFPLSPPALVTPQLGQVDSRQLYVANLVVGTLSLVSYGYDGEPANGAVATPSFSGEGGELAFASSATNLVYGAFNRGDEQGTPGNVFVTSEVSSPVVAGVQTIAPLPAGPVVSPSRELLATEKSGPNGTVLLYVTLPGAGTLRARAKSEVPATVTVSAMKAKGRKKKARASKRTVLTARVVASAATIAKGSGLVVLRLTSAKAYRALVEAHDGLYTTITLTFSAPDEGTLTGTVQATFHGKVAKAAKKAGDKDAKKSTKAAARAKKRKGKRS
jgi:hypothetical protein